jgi:hypothetical protein
MLIWGLDGFIVQIEKDDHVALTKKKKRWKNESAAMKRDEDEEKVNEGKR